MSLADPLDPALLANARLRPVHRPIAFATGRVVMALILREMTTTYGRKPGGYLWAVLEPVAGILVLSWLFSYGFRTPWLGHDFAMFYATGIMPYQLCMTLAGRIAAALRFSKPLLAYPRVTVLDAVAARAILNLLLQLLIAYIVIGGIRATRDTGTTLMLPDILEGFAMAAMLGIGIGAFNCVPTTAFPVYGIVWGLVTRPLMILSGVIFMIDRLPPSFRAYIEWNPLVHVVAQTRSGFYYGYRPDYIDPTYVFLVASGLLAAGILLIWRFHREALET